MLPQGEFQHGEQADAHEAFMLLISKLLEGCIAARGPAISLHTVLRQMHGGRHLQFLFAGLSVTEKEQIEQSSLIGLACLCTRCTHAALF